MKTANIWKNVFQNLTNEELVIKFKETKGKCSEFGTQGYFNALSALKKLMNERNIAW